MISEGSNAYVCHLGSHTIDMQWVQKVYLNLTLRIFYRQQISPDIISSEIFPGCVHTYHK